MAHQLGPYLRILFDFGQLVAKRSTHDEKIDELQSDLFERGPDPAPKDVGVVQRSLGILTRKQPRIGGGVGQDCQIFAQNIL